MTKKHLLILTIFCNLLSFTAFSQGTSCAQATPFCAPPGATVTFPNSTNNTAQTGPYYGCLGSEPNPAWFYFKTTVAGNYVFDLSQYNTSGTTLLDVDFICWGPYTDPLLACNNLDAAHDVSCSFSASATETCVVNGAPAGQYYIVLITNYSNQPGNINFGLTSNSPPTDCSITCPSVLSGPGIVNSPTNGTVAAVPLPATVSCTTGLLSMYASNNTPFGHPITPGVLIKATTNNNTTNTITWVENSTPLATVSTPTNNNYQLQVGYMSPSATNSFSFCETATGFPNMQTLVLNASTSATLSNFAWMDNGSCQTITYPPGTISGVTSWSATCGACLTGVTDWGAAQFDPSKASIGTNTITYSFNPQTAGCPTYTTSVVITVTNPYNAAFTPPGPLCANAACVNLTPTNTYTIGTGTWSGTGVSGTQFCPGTSGAGTFPVTYSVGISSTCKATATNNVVVNPLPVAGAGPTATLTCANTTTVLSGSGGGTYNWAGPGIASGGATANPTVNAPGVYNVTVTASGCSATASVTISQNTTPPAVTGSTSGTITCVTATAQAIASTAASPVSYTWSGPGIVSGGATGTVVANAGGVYSYTVTNTANGCKTTGNVTVPQSSGMPAVAASTSGTITCTTTTAQAIASTTTTPVSYSWTGPGIVSGGTTSSPVVNAGGTYAYTVTNTSNGCTTTGNVSVSQNTTTPAVASSASGTLTCSTNTVQANATTTTTPVSYSWTGPGIVSGGTTSSPVVNAGGSYAYTVTNTSNGCKATGNVTVTQNTATPSVASSASGTLTCSTNTVQANATTTATPVSYSWTGPGIVSGGTTSSPVVNAGGSYAYTVTNTSNGCKTTGTVPVTQNTVTPAVASSANGTITCTNTTAQAMATTTATPVSYSWTGPGIVSGAATGTVVVNAGGSYAYTVTNTSNGCKTAGAVNVSQNNTVITPTITPPAALNCTNTTTGITGTPAAGVTYTWTGPGITAGANSATSSVNQPGIYTLSVTNTANGCVGSTTVSVSQNTATPTVTVSSTQTITCASPTVSITGAATPSTCTPVWTGGVCAGATSYTASACSPNTYTLTVTDPSNGCTASGFVSVIPSTGLPSVTTSNSGSITCTNTSVQVVATTTSTPVTYSWSGPGAVSGAATSNGTVTVGGTYQCVVTNTLTGCSSTVTTNVPSNTTAPSVSIAPTSSITCSTPSLTLSESPSGSPYTVSWTGAGLTGSTVATPTVTQGGNFSVLVTDTANGCTGTATITVPTNTASPTVTVSPTSYTTSCASPTVQLSSTSSDPGVTYSWTSPSSGSLNNSTIQNPVASGTGVFTVVVTSTVSGCSSVVSANSTATVVPDANIPTVSLSANTISLTCVSATASVTATSTNTPVSYSWSPSPLSGGNTNTPTFDTPGNYTLTLTNTSNGCSTFANLAVVTNTTAPVVTASATQTLTCGSPSVTISTTVTPSTGITYSWTGPGIVGPATGSAIGANQTGTYSVTVTDATNGCTNTATSNLAGNTTSPTATIAAVTSSVISCSSPTIVLSVSTTPATGLSYTWAPGAANTATVNAATAGVYNVTVLDAASGCSVSAQYTVTGNTTTPPVTVGNASIPCGTSSTTISASSTNTNATYSWTGPNAGSITSGSNTATPNVSGPGSYTVTVTDPTNGCTTTSVVSVAQTSVEAAFTANPTNGIAPLPVTFTNQSTGATAYTWTFGDTHGSGAANPSNTYTANGTYTVYLVASAGSCSDTAYAVVVVESGLTIQIPNVFTPNGDNINDVFTITSTGVKEIALQIFNRWGEKLYEFSGPNAGWDGHEGHGAKVPDGTYFYFVKATGFDGKTIEKQGTVNLYR